MVCPNQHIPCAVCSHVTTWYVQNSGHRKYTLRVPCPKLDMVCPNYVLVCSLYMDIPCHFQNIPCRFQDILCFTCTYHVPPHFPSAHIPSRVHGSRALETGKVGRRKLQRHRQCHIILPEQQTTLLHHHFTRKSPPATRTVTSRGSDRLRY